MTAELEQAIESLRQATGALAATGPEDVVRLRDALLARGRAIERLAAAVRQASGAGLSADGIAELRALAEVGAQAALRLTLARAALQNELKGLEREQQWLAGVTTTLPGRTSSLDLCG